MEFENAFDFGNYYIFVKIFKMNLDFNIIQQTGWLGGWEIAVIVIIVILLFGGRKIPELMRGLGKGIKEFKEGVGGGDDEKNDETTEETKNTNAKK